MNGLVQLYESCGRPDLDQRFNDNNDEITVLELRKESIGDSVQHHVLKLSGKDKQTWMGGTDIDKNTTTLLQLVQVKLEPDSYSNHRHLNISKANFLAVLQKFGLQRVVGYATSSSQVFNHLPEDSRNKICSYSCAHVDDYFTQVHRVCGHSGTAQGVYWAGRKVLPFFEQAIISQRALASHPFFLNLCTAVSFTAHLDVRLWSTSEEIASIARRTGFKIWELAGFEPAQGDFYTLSARATGFATSLAANKRLNQMSKSILESRSRYYRLNIDAHNRVESEQVHAMSDNIDLFLQSSETQLVMIEFLMTTIQNQLTALFHIITQDDTKIAISLARDSRMIAKSCKSDSSAMKTLAAMTVVFLPGTFISSLFSTSMFDWQAVTASLIINKYFWIYWASTIPLTLVTVVVWLLWRRLEASSYREQEIRSRAESLKDLDPSA